MHLNDGRDRMGRKFLWYSLVIAVLVAVAVLILQRSFVGKGVRGKPPAHSDLHGGLQAGPGDGDTVKLGKVKAPMYGDVIAVAFTDTDTFEIIWGFSKKKAVMDGDSAYPGFGRPMLVVTGDRLQLKEKSVVTLTTSYGEFHYLVQGSEDAVLVDSNHVVSKQDRESLVEYYRAEEVLYLFSVAEGLCYHCEFSGGTNVVI